MLLSVITITKNNPIGFARTKQSVEAQYFKDFEWVVIDGDIEPDSGIYDAMNKGIARASGDYMIFMNAGDCFANAQVLANIAPHLKGDLIYGDALEEGHYKPARHGIVYGMPTHHQAIVYRRSNVRYDTRYKIAADYKFTAQHWRNRTYLPFAICDFEPGGISQQRQALGRAEQAQIRCELKIFAPGVQILQRVMSVFRAHFPQLYWRLRNVVRLQRT